MTTVATLNSFTGRRRNTLEKRAKHIEKALEKPTAILRDWGFYKDFDSDVVHLKGYVYNDSKKRFKDGTYITTSKIKDINLKEGIVITKNTKYFLA